MSFRCCPRRPVAFLAIALATLFAYGCEATLPPAYVGIAPPAAAGAQSAHSVLVLPADVSINVFDEDRARAQRDSSQAIVRAGDLFEQAATLSLERHGYVQAARLGWDGVVTYPHGRMEPVLSAPEVSALYAALSQRQPPPPEILAHAQAATGADALLYTGAYGQDFHGPGTGEKIATGIAIGLFIAVVVVVAIALAASHHSGPSHVHGGGAAVGHTTRVCASTRPPIFPVLDIAVHPEFWPAPAPGASPPGDGESRLGAQMLLIHLPDGALVWHAEQNGQGSPTDEDFVRKVAFHLGAAIPSATGPGRTIAKN